MGITHTILQAVGLAREPQPRPIGPAMRAYLRARYDAAMTTEENRKAWSHADALAADAANNPGVQAILRQRARYEFANNAYCRGIVQTLANDLIGTGPRLQLLAGDREGANRIEIEFNHWAKANKLARKLRTARTAKALDGEAFILLTNDPRSRVPVKLALRLIEADQIATPRPNPLDPRAIDGIELDASGNPTHYHILKQHPGDALHAGFTLEYDRVPAEAVLHWFRADRPDQHRGVCEITPALPLFMQLRRYTLAVLAAAETAADLAVVMQTDMGAEIEDDPEDLPLIELERRLITPLPAGWKAEQMKAEQPSTEYQQFKHELLNEIARCVDMPFNIAACNSSGYNYSSGRLDHQTYDKARDVERDDLIIEVLDRTFWAWHAEASRISGYLPQWARAIQPAFDTQWHFDSREHVDPVKEAQAEAIRLANGTDTYASIYARRGRDWEREFEQAERERKEMERRGLPTADRVVTASGLMTYADAA